MYSGSQFDRLIRLVQETGERVVISLEPEKDPVVLLPLTVYEQLLQKGKVVISENSSHKLPHSTLVPAQTSALQKKTVFSSEKISIGDQASSSSEQGSVDTWDGEEGGEYDAERIFAEIDLEKKSHPSSQAPGRLQESVSRASKTYGNMHSRDVLGSVHREGVYVQEGSLRGEERFSLGLG